MKKALFQIGNSLHSLPTFPRFLILTVITLYLLGGTCVFTIMLGYNFERSLGYTVLSILGFISVFLVGMIWWNAFPEPDEKQEKVKSNGWVWWLIIGGGATMFLLFFHIAPGQLKVFPKSEATFKNTWITDGDIAEFTRQYNSASFLEKRRLEKEPLFGTLLDNKLIVRRVTNE